MVEFFAGVNTEKGFMGFPEEYFSPLKKLYIIKGTAGSGKSTLMKRLAGTLEKKGYEVQLIRCSSDLNSLDGIILPETGAGVADGTAPHVLEANTPVAREILVDAGRYIDGGKLDKTGILLYSDRKKECYAQAYGYIACGVLADRACSKTAEKALDKEKLRTFVKRFYKKLLQSDKKGGTRTRIAAAFTGNGLTVLDPFTATKKVFTVTGGRGTEHLLPEMLKDIAENERADIIISPDATDSARINGIYFTEKDVYVTVLPYENAENINMARFFLPGEYAKTKNRVKESKELCKAAYALAEKSLAAAAENHRELEARYTAAMDFEPLEAEYARILKGLTE